MGTPEERQSFILLELFSKYINIASTDQNDAMNEDNRFNVVAIVSPLDKNLTAWNAYEEFATGNTAWK